MKIRFLVNNKPYKENTMARTIRVVAPVTTEEGKKIVPIEAKVSDGTVNVDGSEYNLVKHQGSGFQYLADAETVSNLENSDATQAMDTLALDEGM